MRCSFVGKEGGLLKWFLELPESSEIKGYCTHFWNGITNVAYAKIIAGIIKYGRFDNLVQLNNIFHIIPADDMSKGNLLGLAQKYSGKNVKIKRQIVELEDLTISTVLKTSNATFWADAGYSGVPTIEELVKESSDTRLN